MHDNRDDRPTNFLDLAPPCLVAKHLFPSHMPVDAFVLSCHAYVGPREVDAPQLAVAAMDRVLELRKWQPMVDHDESSLAFHGRFRTSIGEGQELADCDDAPTP